MTCTRFALFAALLSFASPLHAQDASPEPPPEYAAFVQEALLESSEGHWAEARAAFRQAHEVFPNARTERGMGMVSFELRDYVAAVRHLRRGLSNQVRPLTEAQTIEVQALLDRSLGRVAVFGLDAVPEGAQVTIGDQPVELEEDGTLLLPIDDHHRVVVQGEHRWESNIRVRGGESGPLPMSFEVPEEAPAEPVGPTPPPITAPPIVAADGPPFAAVALTIGGVVAFLSGVAILAAGLADYYAVENATGATRWTDVSGAADRTQAFQAVGYGVMGLGAVLTIGGAIWLGSGGDDTSTGAQLRLGGAF